MGLRYRDFMMYVLGFSWSHATNAQRRCRYSPLASLHSKRVHDETGWTDIRCMLQWRSCAKRRFKSVRWHTNQLACGQMSPTVPSLALTAVSGSDPLLKRGTSESR